MARTFTFLFDVDLPERRLAPVELDVIQTAMRQALRSLARRHPGFGIGEVESAGRRYPDDRNDY